MFESMPSNPYSFELLSSKYDFIIHVQYLGTFFPLNG